jgi:uncharacterized membrane protein YedE/YeeE
MRSAEPDYSDIESNPDFEVHSLDSMVGQAPDPKRSSYAFIRYFLAGIFFGIILVKAQIISWFRIQEMFRLESFHLYGIMGSAVLVGAVSVWIIKKFRIRTIHGDPIVFQKRKFDKGQILGGLLFGCGWAITGACPGPLFAQIGAGFFVVVLTLFSAIAGTWAYGALQEKLPH